LPVGGALLGLLALAALPLGSLSGFLPAFRLACGLVLGLLDLAALGPLALGLLSRTGFCSLGSCLRLASQLLGGDGCRLRVEHLALVGRPGSGLGFGGEFVARIGDAATLR